MKSILIIWLSLGLTCCFSSLGFAKTFEAIVTEVTNGGSAVKATVTDEYGTTEKDVVFHFLPNVDLSDYKTMDNIKAGDQVKIEAEKKQDNNWQISKMEPLRGS
jgi:hypothetical protein